LLVTAMFDASANFTAVGDTHTQAGRHPTSATKVVVLM
jgi:hypothetical protein